MSGASRWLDAEAVSTARPETAAETIRVPVPRRATDLLR
jgi:hypothetical protein